MRRIIWVIVLLGVLSTTIMSCGGRHPYDRRLVAADSLMQDFPDSALVLVEGVCRDSLTAESDRAYRDLLFTQARYRCYITAASDSDINNALAYYRAHSHDREKLTRAYIYKGAVMHELGYPDSAMLYYKTAEATAAPADYYHLGYSNLRIAQLYQSYYTNDSAVVARMKNAAHYFKLAKDTNLLITAIGTQGAYPKIIGEDSARQYLKNAILLSKIIHSPKGLQYQSKLAGVHFFSGNYLGAKDLAMDVVINGGDQANESQFFYYAARAYIKLDLLDSARWIMSMIPAPIDAVDSFNHYQTLAEISMASHRYPDYIRYSQAAKEIDNRIMEASRSSKLVETELEWNADQREKKLTTDFNTMMTRAICVFLMIIAIIIALGIIAYRSKSKQYRLIIEGLKREKDKQLESLNDLQKHFDSLQIKDKNIRQFITTQLKMLRDITANCYHEPNSKLSREIKNIIAFQDKNRHFWPLIYDYIDAEYNGIMSATLEDHPDLNDKELLMLALSCMDFSYIQMSIILGYPNPTSVGTLKTRLSEKIGLPVNEYISSFSTAKTLD